MGQIKTRCSAAAGLFLILLTVIAGFRPVKVIRKTLFLLPNTLHTSMLIREE